MVSAAAATPTTPPRVAVVGGGIAGLAAATTLARAGCAPTLVDMGARLGGRVSSRAVDASSFDHGLQHIVPISPGFRQQVEAWEAAGAVAQWRGRHGQLGADGPFKLRPSTPAAAGASTGFCGSLAGPPMYVGVPTNGALMQHLAEQLAAAPNASILSGTAVQSATREGGGGCGSAPAPWRLRGSRRGRAAAAGSTPAAAEQEDLGSYDALVLADALPLLPGSAGRIAGLEAVSTSLAQLAQSVREAPHAPCFALMVAFEQPLPGVPFDSASFSGASPWAWVANNSSKPGRPAPGAGAPQCWVALTTAERARELLQQFPLSVGGAFNPQTEAYRAAVAQQLLADFRALMAPHVQGGALPEPLSCHAQRWGRAFAEAPLGSEFLFLPTQRLALCGDVAAGSSLEAAWRSGCSAGAAVAAMLQSTAA